MSPFWSTDPKPGLGGNVLVTALILMVLEVVLIYASWDFWVIAGEWLFYHTIGAL